MAPIGSTVVFGDTGWQRMARSSWAANRIGRDRGNTGRAVLHY